jgi:aspartyl protease family protein
MLAAMSKLLPLVLGGAMIVAIFSPRPQPAPAVPGNETAAPAPAVQQKMTGDLTLQRAPDGHFYTDAQVNGTTIRFLVDTGASSVALSRADAQRIGLSFGSSDFTETGEGAGGSIALKPVVLDRVTVGSMDATHVEGVIVDGDMGISLLGQSWLKRVGTVSISDDRMVLR